MIIAPKVRGFVCTTAHPQGCAENVHQQINYVRTQPRFAGPKNVLIIGCSSGYGLASRIVSAYACGAATLGIMFEKFAVGKRTASAGWYNTAAFENHIQQDNLYAKTINGDAFSDDIKQQTIESIKHDFPDGIDLIIYSLAAPKRIDAMGTVYTSTLKTIGKPFTEKTVNVLTGEVSETTIEPATTQEIEHTIKVMGGEDWQLWIDALLNAKVLAKGVRTIAYSYIGPEMTYPIYRHGTIGNAKKHLEATASRIQQTLSVIGGRASISINKAVVTQASSAIPVVPLYVAILYKVMKQKGNHEGCIEQIYRLFAGLYTAQVLTFDDKGFTRLDNWELQDDVQAQVKQVWQQINSDNILDIADLTGYRNEFYRLFGFAVEKIDYKAEINPERNIYSLTNTAV